MKKSLDSTRIFKNNHLNSFLILFTYLFSFSINSNAQKKHTTIPLFDGTSLNGWKILNPSNANYWAVMDSTIVGGDGIRKIPQNTYLYTTETYQDFELRLIFRITGDHKQGLINSGIQYRSLIENNNIIGYQADIGKGYWGDIYDEHRRGKLVGGDLKILKYVFNEEGWNSYIVRCKGNKHELYINGVKVSEYEEKDPNLPSKGVIGIQVHSGGNAKVEFKHITLTHL